MTLRDTLDFRAALTLRNAIRWTKQEDPGADVPAILAALSEHYLVLGVAGWTFTDARGKDVPCNPTTIREHLMAEFDIAAEVADAADDLYAEKVVLPLVFGGSNSSPGTPTPLPTSAPTSGSRKPTPKPSRRSSTSTTPTDATATTSLSPAGASSS